MSGPERRAELSPSELDRLEDALVDLGLGDAPARIDESLPIHLRERLGEYHSILALTHESMPLVEPRDGLLDAVLAEAQRAASIADEAPPRPSLWERVRRSFVLPGFALAVTAALLVVILRPQDDPERLEESPAASKSGEAKMEARELTERTGPSPAAAAPAIAPEASVASEADDAEGGAGPEEEAADYAGEAKKDATTAPPGAIVPEDKASRAAKKEKSAPPKKPTASSKSAKVDDPFDAAPKPSPSDVDVNDKDALRTQLSAADKARYAGRCGDATSKYQQLRGVGGVEEARALVGLGLCAEASGDNGRAADYFKQARALAPAIDSLIASERQKMGATSKKASKIDVDGQSRN